MKAWKVWGGVVLLVAAGVGGYLGFDALTDSGAEGDAVQTQLVPVTRGNLVNDVSVTGTLTYATREAVSFGQQGTVVEVSVSEGDEVSAGDPLARLDDETAANLEQAVAQARVDLRIAEEALDEARSPYTAAQIARAESDVANARVDLREAEEELKELGVVSPDLLAQARIDILNARADLESANENKNTLVSPGFQDIAKAQSDVTDARLALQDAEDELDALLNPTDSDIAAAEAEVSGARLDLQVARDALEALTNVDTLDLAKARADVADAELDVETAQAALDEATTPATAEDIADYEADIDSTTDTLVGAQFDFETAERNAEEKIGDASADLETARADYNAVFAKWLGMSIAPDYGRPHEEILGAHDTDLESLLGESRRLELMSRFEEGVVVDDPATPWNEVVVFTWAVFYPGDILVDCGNLEPGPFRACIQDEFVDAYETVVELAAALETVEAEESEKVRKASVAVSTADDTLGLRRQALDDYLAEVSDSAPSESEIRSKVEALALARATLRSLEEDLRDLTAGPDLIEYESKQQDIVLAETGLEDALETLASLTGEPDELLLDSRSRAVETARADLLDAETALSELTRADELDVELADREIELAEAKLSDAEDALSALLEEPDPLDVSVKQTAVRLAAETLAEAEATLEEYNSVDQLEVELRQADVISARAALETAVADLESATLRAPFDGVVVAVNVEVGRQVNANTEAVEIADPSVVEVSGSVDEIDVLFLQTGAEAIVSLDALGTQTLRGTVSSIASSGAAQQGIVTYPVTIRVESTENIQLPEGLSATAQVIIREQTDALLVPLQALYGTVQAPMVRVVIGNNVTERPVTLGINDDFWVVVEEGLREGETVSMEVVGTGTSQFGGLGATFRAVGGIGGPGGARPTGPGGGR